MRTNYDSLVTAFPGKIVFPVRTTYRAYSGVSPTAQEGGSLPFNQQIVDPSVAANQATAYDSALAIPRVDLYSAALLNRGALSSGDPVHYATYAWYQAELVRTAVRFAYTGAWPASFIETQVAKAEATALSADINEAQYSVNSLAASNAKTAFQIRLNAISPPTTGTPGAYLINDTFTTASDVDLSAYTPEAGGTPTASTASTIIVSAATGKARKGPATTGGVYATYLYPTAPTAANYDIDIDVQFPTVFSFFLVFRALSDANNVFAGYSASNGWTLGTRLSSTNTTVNNTAFTAPAGTTSYHLKVQVRGDVMTLLVDGVVKATGTITAKPGTLIGLEYPTTSFAGSDTVGPQLKGFHVMENPS